MATFSLGGWQVEPDALRLRAHDGTAVAIGERAMGVLRTLVAAEGAVVSKDDLMAQVWGDVAVTQNSLNQAISELRQALRDDASSPRFIETIRGRGYRLVVPLTDGQSAREPIGPHRTSTRPWVPGLGVLVVAVVAVLLWIVANPSSFELEVPAPDGASVAYLGTHEGRTRLRVVEHVSGVERELHQMPRPETLTLAWSTDATRIAVDATEPTDAAHTIVIASLEGAQLRAIGFPRVSDRNGRFLLEDLRASESSTEVHASRSIALVFEAGKLEAINWQALVN